MELIIAGRYYHRDVQVTPGTRLRLVREPGNRHDPHAIRVVLDDPSQAMAGYVMRNRARALAAYMDSGLYELEDAVAVEDPFGAVLGNTPDSATEHMVCTVVAHPGANE
jgi:hypothetical protein